MTDVQPSGTVTLVFTDVEGSTRLLEELGTDAYREALAEHRRVVRAACARHEGYEVDYDGDAFFYAFATAQAAVSAVSDAMVALNAGPIHIRVGIHTGEPALDPPKYVGMDVHRAARIMSAAHGGQVVLSPSTASLLEPGSFELVDLGEHRLKDIEGAVSIFQLGVGSFPPLKTISNTNLPRPASSFVGREAELEEVLARIDGGARLVTLTGPGGTGKTRLALEAATSLVPEYKAGVFWVGLAALRDPALVTDTISQTLGAKDGLVEHIGERELLLLLDNLEQVIAAAPALSSLLQSCPNLTLLVTSRELLRISGEVEYPVPPLAEPEAVSLFCERAQLEPSEEIAELCAHLDSLPLAVELAAARAKALSPAQILERLSQRLDLLKGGRDSDPRQQTLRATIEWSYDLLAPEEQQLFTRLSVFAGGCTLEAAEGVAGADLDTLQSLVEKSLLRFTNERYWMLETIREYASERLDAPGEGDALRDRHAEHFLALAEEAYPHLTGNPKEWLDRLEAEHDNFRAAVDRFDAAGITQLVLRFTGALWQFWTMKGHLVEGRHRLEAALTKDLHPTSARGKALIGATAMQLDAGATTAAKRHAEEALALCQALADEWGTATAVRWLGNVSAEEGNLAKARELHEESVRRFNEVGDSRSALLTTRMLAGTCLRMGEREHARALYEDVLRRARAAPDGQMEAATLVDLAEIAANERRFDDALAMLRRSLRIDHEIGDVPWMIVELRGIARALAAVGSADRAAIVLSSSEALREAIGGPPSEVSEGLRITMRNELDEAAFAAASEQGRALTVDEAVALALDSLD